MFFVSSTKCHFKKNIQIVQIQYGKDIHTYTNSNQNI